ncbi:MAG: uroporphyrinogen decarboxylase family protein [Alphaproteobacteria bacterium]|uniref:Uroporphyrinogen decarboxylase family protein n=1 Tax=Candidatus Nitrobium versatile TaxID=2884831 RepID=A0A953M216_9BACT|nr:uroporphyrinogen decarboxylase family protein [Candidatus Nitrobium versatile]
MKNGLTGLQRVTAALQHKEADRVPVAPLVCGASHRVAGLSYEEWARGGNVEAMVRGHVDTLKILGHDSVVTLIDLSVEAEAFGAEICYPGMSTPHPNYEKPFVQSAADYGKIGKINPRKTGRMKTVIDMIGGLSREIGETHAIVGFAYGSIGTLSMMRGPEKFFMDLMEYPDEVLGAIEVLDEVLVDYVKAQAEAGAHAVCVDHLYCSGSILSKSLWERFEGNSLRRVCNAIREAGAIVALHNCGNDIYFDMSEKWANPTAISHAFMADDVNSWEEQKLKWGGKIASIGWIPPGPVAMLGTPDEIEEEVKEEIEIFAKDGGFILSTGCEFPPNAPLWNAKHIVECSQKYGAQL